VRTVWLPILIVLAVGCARGAPEFVTEADPNTPCNGPGCVTELPDAGAPDVGVDAPDQDAEDCEALWYPDSDNDGFGNEIGQGVTACRQPVGYVASKTDCDDADAAVNTGAIEQPGDGIDQNCDGMEICFADEDGDGHRTPEATTVLVQGACDGVGVTGAAAPADDCDDGDAAIHGAAAEVCDGIDNDCDGLVEAQGECPCDFIANLGSNYLFCDTLRQWPESRGLCEQYGSVLVTINDGQEDQWIANQMANRGWGAVWIGASDAAVEGQFVWLDGSPVAFSAWRDQEPNDAGNGGADGGADCAARVIGDNPGWVDRSCADEYAFICETP
jgi:hypothetical protein